MSSASPVVGIICDYRLSGAHGFHRTGEKYIDAIRDGAQALPLLIPVLDPPIPPQDILNVVDGLLFTGAPSNVAPKLYGGRSPRPGTLQDEKRDATSITLIQTAIAQAKPVFCICRGFQELNVASGGTLHQHLYEVPGRVDHREDTSAPLDVQFGPAHKVQVMTGGLLETLLGTDPLIVNSVHGQGVDQLAPSLFAEALAEDGTVEAVTMPGARGFVLGTQWHPEYRWSENPSSRILFRAFGDAIRV